MGRVVLAVPRPSNQVISLLRRAEKTQNLDSIGEKSSLQGLNARVIFPKSWLTM